MLPEPYDVKMHRYAERLALFTAEHADLTVVGTQQFHVGDQVPSCSACGSNKTYFFYKLKDAQGNEFLLGKDCYRALGYPE